MPNDFLQTPVEYVKGVGPQRAELLKKELNIFSCGDLLYHFPFRYIDRSRFYKIREVNAELPYIQIRGFIEEAVILGDKRKQRLEASLRDDTGKIKLVWFQGIKWIREALRPGIEYVVFGRPAAFKSQVNIAHPEIEPVSSYNTSLSAALQPVYGTTEKLKARGLDSKAIGKLIAGILQALPEPFTETLPATIRSSYRLMGYRDSLINIHQPRNPLMLQNARFRLKFEELFFIQLRLLRMKVERKEKNKGHRFGQIGEYFNRFYHEKLPFPLTEAQKKVLREIRQDLGSGRQMNRMLQGDVGSGKTLVALMTMLMALDNGMQACLMAPTEILAAQHFESITKLLEGLDITAGLLTGNTRAAKRKETDLLLREGSLQILIGTHALLENNVQFKNLGLVIIDEQHRFGVEQRARLWKKNEELPHVLVMTATPIPRTLAMTLYGDLDTSVIDELPPGRKPVTTLHKYDASRLWVFGFMKQQIDLGRQVYVVYPLIKESESMDYKDLMDGYEGVTRAFPPPRYQVSIVHGKMKPAAKEYEMDRFVKGRSHIMVATTVIEVGVNVPNASVMVIESAERFGLSQLHQLRGRVGRGADQSYCILMTGHKLSTESKLRIDTMVRTNDGFEIAETDLRLRGPGDLAGTQQSGVLDLRLSDLARDGAILQASRDAASQLLDKDPHLALPENQCLKNHFQYNRQNRTNWSLIS
jgi:ATP-dependent DNA helicase RecG